MQYFYKGKEHGNIIMIYGRRKPVKRKQPFIVNVYDDDLKKWGLACFPEITWAALSKNFVYIGKVKNV